MTVLPARAAAEPDSEADSAVAWAEDRASLVDVSAAKLHVLQLEPIKIRLGARWARLADLVHKLFEKALRRAQGPSDHFVAVCELSYVVTFHGLSLNEASLACTAGEFPGSSDNCGVLDLPASCASTCRAPAIV